MISKNQIKHVQALHSKKNREQSGFFIVEGVKLVTEFIENRFFEVKEIFALPDYIHQHLKTLDGYQIRYNEITDNELQKISLLSTPNQVLAVVKQIKYSLDIKSLNESTTLFLDDIRDPGNLGTIIRIADWFGIKQIICSPNCAELYNPKTLQATMGAILRVSVIISEFSELRGHLKNKPIYGAVLHGKNIYVEDLQKGLIIIGNEANGISESVMNYVSHPITVPPANENGSESLNAANACAIICSEFHRQLNYSISH